VEIFMPLLDVLGDGRYEASLPGGPFGLALRVDLTRPAPFLFRQISGDKVLPRGNELVVMDSFQATAFIPDFPDRPVEDSFRVDILWIKTKAPAALLFTLDTGGNLLLTYSEPVAGRLNERSPEYHAVIERCGWIQGPSGSVVKSFHNRLPASSQIACCTRVARQGTEYQPR